MIRNQLRSLNYGIIRSLTVLLSSAEPKSGGGIITNHQIHQGISMHSGTLEHMCINPDGPLCYCGSRGCLETYCSANALEQAEACLPKIFSLFCAKKISPDHTDLERYLNHLAFA